MKVVVSGFGPSALKLAGRIGDGFCAVGPDEDSVKLFRESGGEGKVVQGTPCGPDLDKPMEAIDAYRQAGFDELYVNQIGPEQEAFFAACQDRIRPALG